MNRKQFLISIILLAILCLAGYMVFKKNAESWNSKKYSAVGENIFNELDVNRISKVSICSGREAATLLKKENEWIVAEKSGYPADFRKIAGLLKKFYEVKSVQKIRAGKSQLGKLNLTGDDREKGNAVLIELFDDQEKKAASIMLGKKHCKKGESGNPYFEGSCPDGRYVLNLDGANSPCLVSDPFEDATSDPLSWLDKAFYEIDKIKTVDVRKANNDESWKISRNTERDDFILADAKEGEEFDKSKISFPSFLKYVSFRDVKPATQELKFSEDITIDTFDGFKYELKAAGKEDDKDKYWINMKGGCVIPEKREIKGDEKAEDKEKLDREFAEKIQKLKEKLEKENAFSGWVYLLAKSDIDSVLKIRKDLMKPKKEEKKEGQNDEKAKTGEE